MFVVITKVQLKPGNIDKVKRLFEETNPDLVKGQTDWLEAKFTANLEEDHVTVLAFWRNGDSYKEFSSSESFRNVMVQFAPYSAGKPEISINKILFEM